MTTKYLLPCACGKTTPIEASQAGETFSCACGEPLIAPTLRGIRQLPVADDSALAQGRPGRSSLAGGAWGPTQAILLLGAIFTLAGGATEAYLLATSPKINPARVDREAGRLGVAQSWASWLSFQQGIEHGQYSYESGMIAFGGGRRKKAAISGGIAIAVGLAMLSLGTYHFLTSPTPRRQP